MINHDTICAVSTPPGSGAIAVIRLSGKDAFKIIRKIIPPKAKKSLAHGAVFLADIMDGKQLVDNALISVYKAPKSYTGEDVAEISCHGSVFIQQKILELLINRGAVPAKPGEFTRRAFLGGKMDLSQAEAVADLIASETEASHRLAIQQARGGFSKEIQKLREQLLHFMSLIELELDFSEEDVEFADRRELLALFNDIHRMVQKLTDSFRMGNVIKNGVPVTIIGEPNVGKSTLLNVLLEEERAIVSEIPGTTRDYIEDVMTLEGIKFRFIDTAGLRNAADEIETMGVVRTYERIEKAGVVLLMVDAADSLAGINNKIALIREKLTDQVFFILINKIDKLPGINIDSAKIHAEKILFISAGKKTNIDQLKSELVNAVQHNMNQGDIVVTNIRHYEALKKTIEAIERTRQGLADDIPGDLLAQDIREANRSLGEIVGEISDNEVLGSIFERFCIGK